MSMSRLLYMDECGDNLDLMRTLLPDHTIYGVSYYNEALDYLMPKVDSNFHEIINSPQIDLIILSNGRDGKHPLEFLSNLSPRDDIPPIISFSTQEIGMVKKRYVESYHAPRFYFRLPFHNITKVKKTIDDLLAGYTDH